jgi:hypothetical protein
MEVVLAMGIAAGLLAGIFMIASGSLSLSDKVVTEGRSEGRRESFLNFLERSFLELPGNAEIRLLTTETSSRLLPTMTIQNAPTSFSFAGLPVSAEAVVLTTVPVPGNKINVVLEYYEEPLLNTDDQLAAERPEPDGSIILYRDIWRFEIRALDVNTLEFLIEWDVRGRLPLQLEMNAVFEPDGEEVVHHFWLPTKVSPAQLVRSVQGGGGRNGPRSNRRAGTANPQQPGGGQGAQPGGGGQ